MRGPEAEFEEFRAGIEQELEALADSEASFRALCFGCFCSAAETDGILLRGDRRHQRAQGLSVGGRSRRLRVQGRSQTVVELLQIFCHVTGPPKLHDYSMLLTDNALARIANNLLR
jgi:hypothetical protein